VDSVSGVELSVNGAGAAEAGEIEFFLAEDAEFDGLGVGAEFGGGEFVEEAGEGFEG